MAQAELLKPSSLVKEAKKSNKNLNANIFTLSADRSPVSIPAELDEYSVLKLDKKAISTISKTKATMITLTIPQNGRNNITLELVEVNPFAENFILRAAPSMEIMSNDPGKHYRGIIQGQEKSIASISIYGEEVMGLISHPSATGNLVLGKLENTDQHILYQDDQIVNKRKASCQVADSNEHYSDEELRGIKTGTRALTDCVRLYIEVDNDIYINKGSSTTSVNNYVGGIFNQVSTLYANEQIKTVVSEILVWTQASPYNATSSDGMLNAFAAQRQGFNGDLGMLLSYKVGGGIAWVNGLCRSNPDYSMSYSGIQSSYQNVPTYSWTVEVCAHEFGHLFGSQHTHACVWNGNNTAIDGCATPEGSCANPGMPSAALGGTIMSYCHLTSVGIKFANGFGPQPGNVMRSRVTNATCLQPCDGGGSGGGGTTCTENTLTIELRTDSYANETTWEIKNSSGVIQYTGGPYGSANTLNVQTLCLPSGCYTFTIRDTYGDGICCSYGNGSYTIKQGTSTLITGGQFGTTETKSFCTSGTVSSNLTLSSTGQTVGSTASSTSVGVTSNVSWTASSNATSWCTVSPSSGSNNGTLTVAYGANTASAARTATITVVGGGITRTYTLTQSGVSSNLTLSSAGQNVGSSASSASVGVTSNITWTASSNATSWCTVSPSSGSNNGTLTVTYGANTASAARTATITVVGGGITRTYALTQSGVSSSLTLSSTGQTVGSTASSTSVGVTSNVAWSASSNGTSWCTVSPSSGSNNGTLSIVYSANTGTTSRSAVITVSGGGISTTYSLTQTGASSNLTLSSAGQTVGSTASNASIGVTSNVSWSASSNATSWCNVSPNSGSNNGTLTITYSTNTGTTSRSANITVTGGGITRTYVLTQNGASTNLSLTSSGQTVAASSGTTSVGVVSNIAWSASSNAPAWCNVSPSTGSNNGTLSVSYGANTSSTARSATITVTGLGGSQSYTLTQNGVSNNLTLSSTGQTVGQTGGTASVGVTSNIAWTAVSNATSWCTVSPSSGSNNGTLSITYSAHTGSAARTATISVTGGGITQNFVLTQNGNCNNIVVEIKTDQYPTEITWNIKDAQGAIVANGGNYGSPYNVFTSNYCLASGCYTFNISDTYGDGILSPGYFRVLQGTTEAVSNSVYGASKTINFCLGGTVNPTCNDGIKNGNETGIDCGGTCVPCSSCNDGIKNGNETGIDCGGSCIPCATCNDGIKNGNETGVDCGGSCTPCTSCNDGIKNGNETGIDCGGSCTPCATCNDGIKNGNETGVDCGGSCSACGDCVNIKVEIRTDQYPTEISWNIKNASGNIVANRSGYTLSQSLYPNDYCLPAGCYTFNITDTYGDGILSPGYFRILNGANILLNNTLYTYSGSFSFCIGSTAPTCTDGIKNGNETGIDCGGSCQPCSTSSCTDGIKNGNETGIDCGGSCAPCATCNDGIKNGNETGIDCGGSCPPCSTGGSGTILSGSYFENGWDGWIDGGGDCVRYFGSLTPEGDYSIRIRDDSDTQSAMTSPVINLAAFNTVKIEFMFRSNGMEAGEDFWLRYFNGTQWNTVATFASGTAFVNNQLYTSTITLTGQFPTNAQFRFQCDASDNDDEVYIDAVIIRASSGANLVQDIITIQSENNIVMGDNLLTGMTITPNPAENIIRIHVNDKIEKLEIFNVSGQLIALPVIEDERSINISGLRPGVYIIRAETGEDVFVQRFVKI